MPHTDLSPAEQKALFKEALHEWLDQQFATVGRWTVKGLAVLIVGGLATWAFSMGHIGR